MSDTTVWPQYYRQDVALIKLTDHRNNRDTYINPVHIVNIKDGPICTIKLVNGLTILVGESTDKVFELITEWNTRPVCEERLIR